MDELNFRAAGAVNCFVQLCTDHQLCTATIEPCDTRISHQHTLKQVLASDKQTNKQKTNKQIKTKQTNMQKSRPTILIPLCLICTHLVLALSTNNQHDSTNLPNSRFFSFLLNRRAYKLSTYSWSPAGSFHYS